MDDHEQAEVLHSEEISCESENASIEKPVSVLVQNDCEQALAISIDGSTFESVELEPYSVATNDSLDSPIDTSGDFVSVEDGTDTPTAPESTDNSNLSSQAVSPDKLEEKTYDILSIENENVKELQLMNDINCLQFELKTAANKVNSLQQQVQVMDKYKQIAESYYSVSKGQTDPIVWYAAISKVEEDNLSKEVSKNQELGKKISALEKERNDLVVKNAKIEKSVLDNKKLAETAAKEMKKSKASDEKAKAEAEKFRKISNQAIKEHASMKDQFTSNMNKLKWMENKLQIESEALALEKEKNLRLQRELKMAKEETNQIRANTQQIISTYQNSEEVRSNALDGELKNLQLKYEGTKAERDAFYKELMDKSSELEAVTDNLINANSKAEHFEADRNQLLEERNTMAETLNRQKMDLTGMGSKLATCHKQLSEAESERNALHIDIASVTDRADDLYAQFKAKQKRESDLSSTVSTLTEENTKLNNEIEDLSSQVENLKSAEATLHKTIAELDNIKHKFTDIENSSKKDIEELKSTLDTTKIDLEYTSNRTRALEKQNLTLKKELRGALQNAKGLIRAGSINSIDSMDKNSITDASHGRSISQQSTPAQSPKHQRGGKAASSENGLNSMDKDEIIRRLIHTQKQYVKRSEKIDFLSDHVLQLTDELKKKTKLIQSFLLREQHGRIKPPGREQELHKKVNNIMDSIYNQNTTDNIHIMKDVNRQLQLVLEDTLFKNMMQQDNIKHLGEEIDKIQRHCKCKPNTR